MRLIYPAEQSKIPFAFKLFFVSVAGAIFAVLGGMTFMIFVIMSDPHSAGETFGEVGASIINGFNHVLED